MMDENRLKSKEIGLFESWIIPVGAMTQGFLFVLVGSFAMYYYTDIIGLAPVAIGIMFLIVRIWDAVFDPIIGIIADRTHTKWGKFKPYIIFGPVAVTTMAILVFSVPGGSYTLRFIYATATYTLFCMAYTVVDIPIWAFPTTMCRDGNLVTKILSRTQLLTTLGGITASIVTMMLVGILAANMSDGFRNTALLYGAVALIVTSVAGITSKERVKTKINKEKTSIREISKIVLGNKALIIATSILILISLLFSLKIMVIPYYAEYNLNNKNLVALIMIACSIPGLVGIAVAPYIAIRFGKKSPSILFLAIAAILNLMAYLAGYHSLTFILVLQGMASFFLFVPMVIATTMFGDCVTFTEWKFGVRFEGLIFSFRTLTGKIGAALAGLLCGAILTLTGYIANQPQTQTAMNGIHASVTLYSAVIITIAIIPLCFNNLTKKKMAEIEKELEERKKGL